MGDGFGSAVSLSGDTLLIGARYEDSAAKGVSGNEADNSAVDSGAAYVFTRSGTTWSQKSYMKASNTDAGDNFGISVSLSSSDTLVVGAHLEDSNGYVVDNSSLDSGAAYRFGFLPTTLVNSVLPTSRSVPVGTLATIFNSVINSGWTAAYGVTLSMNPALAGTFAYQQTDCATNAIIGSPNPSLNLPARGVLCYVLFFTPSATFAATSVQIQAQTQDNSASSTDLFPGVNTWLLRSTSTPEVDIIALTTTVDFHQVACSGANAFAVALSNVGAAAVGDITVTANTGSATLPLGISMPLSISISETDPGTGAIIGDNILQNVGAGENRTVGVFVTFNGCIGFFPAANRIFIEFRDASNNVVGSTSTAVSTNR